MRASRNRGAILIIVLGVLAVLALLGTTFATLQATERHVARNYEDTVRAKMLAMSGVQDAIARISSFSGGFIDPAMTYWGNNIGETGSPDWTTPLERAQSPSYAIEDEAIQDPTDKIVKPIMVEIDGVNVGLSGASPGTYAINGDVFRVRVTDANSLLYLNDGLDGGPTGTTSRNLQRILNNLGDSLSLRGIGDKILEKRPPGGYVAKRELEVVLGPAHAAKISPFVTTRAWVDKNVANPVPISQETLSSYPVKYNEKLGIFRYGRSFGTGGVAASSWPLRFAPEHADPRGVDHAIMALDELNPQYIEITHRAPININLAPKEILTSIISGLQGVFLVERRKSNPHPWNVYSFMGHPQYDNTPAGRRGDEYGYLYSTVPFAKPGATTTGGVEASKIADEIVACRNKAKSPSCPGLEYGTVWYGGQFKSWRQFNAFCDGLVEGGLLKDERPIFYDFKASAKTGAISNTGPDELVPAPLQPRYAAQAMADVLKANFNPNLTLNEINADANLFTIVDKTDLVTCSTEFCFTPMGIFEIESEGMVVSTLRGKDLLQIRKGEMVARKRILSIAKVYDVYRETSQADFYDGKIDAAVGGPATDNGKRLVLGPEPDIGTVASDCRYSGFIQLSTIGGASGHAGPERGAAAHGHFSQNFDLHHHAGGQEKLLRAKGGGYVNNRDRTESVAGPYDPTFQAPGRHRLARSWTEDERKNGTVAAPDYIAPSDLRIDGAYVERDSALMWENSASVFGMEGTVSYWIKPSFTPEMTGKPRTYFCVDQPFRQKNPATLVQLMHGHWFFASHDAEAGAASPNETAPLTYAQGPWVPISMAAGYSTHESYGGALGMVTPSLNHKSHADSTQKDLFRRNGWTHVTYHWDMKTHRMTLLINGQALPNTRNIKVHPQNFNAVDDFLGAPLRIGEPSTTMVVARGQSRNWSADSTIDEFYLWKGNHVDDAQEFWSRGRYYIPRTGKEATFTSRNLDLGSHDLRNMAPPLSGRMGTVTVTGPQVRVLGASWTWYPESTGKNGEPGIIDYRHYDPLTARVDLTMVQNGQPVGETLHQDGGMPIGHLFVNPGDTLNYRLRLHVPDAELDSILLGTPIVDDVTIFYTTGTKYLYYELVGTGL
jgi:hypothetical protein